MVPTACRGLLPHGRVHDIRDIDRARTHIEPKWPAARGDLPTVSLLVTTSRVAPL